MVIRARRDFLLTEIAAVEELIRGVVPHDVFGKMSMEERLVELQSELRALGDAVEEPAAEGLALLFEGEPVVGNSAIEAEFSAKAITQIQEVAARLNARREGRELAMAGPIPLRRESKLYITGLKAGSFGFQLDEAPGQSKDGGRSIRPVLQDIADLIVSASESDEALDEAMPALDQRTLSSLKDFFEHVGGSNASLHVVSGTLDRSIPNEDLRRAAQRVSRVHITDERVLELKGKLLGVLPESRQFEFVRTDNEQTIKGRISPEISRLALLGIAESLAYRHCVAKIRQTSLLRGEQQAKLKYELLGLVLDSEIYGGGR